MQTEEHDKHSGTTKDKFDKNVSLVCWAYNEEECIKEFLETATKLLDENVSDYEIVLIDDASKDKTYEIARTFQEKNPRLKIFKNERNLNIAISCQRAIQKASKEFLFWQSVDWGYDISNLRQFLEYLKKYDVVQGVRVKPADVKIKFLKPLAFFLKLFGIKHITRRSDTIVKAFISLVNYLIIRFLFRVPLSDFQNVTFYPTAWIQSIHFESKSSFINPEALIKSYWNGKSIKEVPIDFISRKKGAAKGTKLKSILRSIYDIFRLWFKWVVLRRKF